MLVYVHFHGFINLMLHSHLQCAVCSLQISYTGDVPYLKLDLILILASTSCSGQPQTHIVLLSCKVFHCSNDPSHISNTKGPKPKV